MEFRQAVTGFIKGFSESALRLPYVLATLACGHTGPVEFKPSIGGCMKCGTAQAMARFGSTTQCRKCGGTSFTMTWQPDRHNEADYLTTVGSVISCPECQLHEVDMRRLREVDVATVHHSRAKDWGGVTQYHLYRLAPESPSNFWLLFSVTACPAVDALMRERGLSGPLSPVEPA
jgi:Zn finger protein HypA/HybF involved in hydrogenase expression